jgi:uncharacterized protein (TIGR04255 family)
VAARRKKQTHVQKERLYLAAPIVEAVVELRFSTSIDLRRLRSLSRKLKTFYPSAIEQKTRGVSVDFAVQRASFTDEEDIVRRSTSDETEIAVLKTKSLVFSRLAPYTEWSDFRGRIERDLTLIFAQKPTRTVERVGMRYINRIDLPAVDGISPYEDYLNLYVKIPEIIDGVGSYALTFDTKRDDVGIRVQSGRTDAPVPGTFAILLDIDVFKTKETPSDLDGIMFLLDKLRDEKNILFESFVTDEARRLFNNG